MGCNTLVDVIHIRNPNSVYLININEDEIGDRIDSKRKPSLVVNLGIESIANEVRFDTMVFDLFFQRRVSTTI